MQLLRKLTNIGNDGVNHSRNVVANQKILSSAGSIGKAQRMLGVKPSEKNLLGLEI